MQGLFPDFFPEELKEQPCIFKKTGVAYLVHKMYNYAIL